MPTLTDTIPGIPGDRYAVEREIGRGGFATVYVARDLRHHRRVAIKILHQGIAAFGVGAERFQSEIELAASLAHPNIVPVFDSGVAGDTLYYVMPLVEGESLRDRLERERALPLADALRIARDMANALAYAHARGVVHRDIKPENVLLMSSGGHALIADFGIAKALAGDGAGRGKLTMTGSVIGTRLYMSPEQSFGLPVDTRADIYSLGAVVFEMLTGLRPMPGSKARMAFMDTPTGEMAAASVSTAPARLPRALRGVLARALSDDPAARHPTVDAFIADLEGAQPGDGLLARLAQTPARWRRAGGRTRAVVAIVAVVGAGGMAAALLARGAGDARTGRGLVVFPFRAMTAAAAEWREAVPDLLATQLDGTPGIRVADPWSLWMPLRGRHDDVARSPDPQEARELANRAGACCYVLGTVSQVPGRIDLSVRVYRVGSREPWHTFAVGGAPDSVGSIVRQASLELMSRLADNGGAAGIPRGDQGMPRTPAALREWLVAREHLRRGRLDSANVAITRSLAEDSAFVASLADAVTIRSWLQFVRAEPYSGLRELAARAVAISDSLPDGGRARLRARATLASIRTDGPGVARWTSEILAQDPTDFEAWNLLSYSHISLGWQYGVTPAEMREAAERLYRLDTTSMTSLARRAFVAAALNDPDDVRAQLQPLRRTDTAFALTRGMLRGIEGLLATDAAFTAALPTRHHAPAAEYIAIIRMLRMFRPDRTEQLARATVADVGSANRPIALGTLVQLLMAGSRMRAMDSMRASGVFGIRPGFDAVVDRMTVAAAIAGGAPAEDAVVPVARLEEGMTPDSAKALFMKRSVWHDGWLVGAYHAMYGDTALARRWGAALGALPAGGSPREYGRALEADVASRLAVRRGDRAEALRQARVAYTLWDIHSENALEMLPEPAIRFQFASMLRDAGRADSARAMFSSFVPPTTWMGFYTARGALELAELQERAGERRDAERNFLIATLLWERADPTAAWLRNRARAGLRRLAD